MWLSPHGRVCVLMVIHSIFVQYTTFGLVEKTEKEICIYSLFYKYIVTFITNLCGFYVTIWDYFGISSKLGLLQIRLLIAGCLYFTFISERYLPRA